MWKEKTYDEIIKKLHGEKLTDSYLISPVFNCLCIHHSKTTLSPRIYLLDFIYNYLESQLNDTMITDRDTFDMVINLSFNKIIHIMPHETELFIILFIKKFIDSNIVLISSHNIDIIKNYIETEIEKYTYSAVKPFKSDIYALLIIWIELQRLISYYNTNALSSDESNLYESSIITESHISIPRNDISTNNNCNNTIRLYINREFMKNLLNNYFLSTPLFEYEEIPEFLSNIGLCIKSKIIMLYKVSEIINYETLLSFQTYITQQLIFFLSQTPEVKILLAEYIYGEEIENDRLTLAEIEALIIELSEYTIKLYNIMTLNSLSSYFKRLLQVLIKEEYIRSEVFDELFNVIRLLEQFDYDFLVENSISPIELLNKLKDHENVTDLITVIVDNTVQEVNTETLQFSDKGFEDVVKTLIDKVISINEYHCNGLELRNKLLFLFGLYLEEYDDLNQCNKLIEHLKTPGNYLGGEEQGRSIELFIQRYDLENYKIEKT